jgi:chromosome segregation ATPase
MITTTTSTPIPTPYRPPRARSATATPTTIPRAFGDAKFSFFRSDKSELARVKYLLESEQAHSLKLARERREMEKERDDAVEALDMYKRRLKEAEKDVFKLEKALEEKTAGVETAMAIARRQIKATEEARVKAEGERDALRAKLDEIREQS